MYNGVMLLPSKKYATEMIENSYRTHMKLTVRDLQEADFGNYRCISKNSLGETEGSIRLYGNVLKGVVRICMVKFDPLHVARGS
nr:unnamed protein product [Callosobruchus chinensis]